ncbi:MAG: DNA-protecting protein DprA [Bacteroidetes bacterium]|nr:DNA-protecting protein DprA [Bacteroidota bacterium]
MSIPASDDLLFKISATLIPGVGNMLAKSLVSYCGGFKEIFLEKKSSLEKIPGVGSVTAEKILKFNDFKRAEEEIKFIDKYQIAAYSYLDKEYPERLRNCLDSPVMLYFKGQADLNTPRNIAIVGTRKATPYGRTITEQLVADLSAYNVTVTSGMAYGIDIAAHKQAVKSNVATIAVLGHGLDRIYPATHHATAEKMLHHGGLLSEYLSQTNPDRENFPTRNRIIAGMTDCIIVVEAAKSGGALITAEIAISYNRDIFAIPGRVEDEHSQGCNQLIKANKAMLIENAEDIANALGWNDKKIPEKKSFQAKLFIELKPDEKTVFNYIINNDECSIDALCLGCELTMSRTSAALLGLEFASLIKSLPGKRYKCL